jgi:O-antigen/teichoic acid export membrane protein
MGVGLVLSPILSVHFNHRDFAIVGYFNSFNLLFVPIIGFTFASYYSKTYFKVNAEQRKLIRKTLASAQLGLGAVSLFVLLGLFYFYSRAANVGYSFYPDAILCYSSIVFSNIFSFYLIDLRLSKQAKRFMLTSVVHHVLYFLVMYFLCAVFKYGASGSLAATLVVSIIMGVYCFRKMTDRFALDRRLLLDALKFCWPLIIAGCVHYFSSGIDRAMLASLRDDYNLGLYSIAMRFVGYITLFYSALTMTVEPDLYQAIAQKRYKRLLFVIFGLLAANTALVIVFMLMSPILIQVLTVGRYTAAVHLTRIMALKNITASVFFITAIIINALGYSKVTLVNRVLAAIFVSVMFRVLITKYQFEGAAWGQVLSYVVMTFFSFIFVSYKYLQRKKRLAAADQLLR